MPSAAGSADRFAVAKLLGREPRGDFKVAVRDESGEPVVILNSPLLDDGTPMPTRYWLVGRAEIDAVGALESIGGVRLAEEAVDPGELAAAHGRYAAERDAALPPGHEGHRPSGGVGGTRKGVKCLHAHVAWWLAGGDDPVGRWAAARSGIDQRRYLREPADRAPVAAVDCGTNSTRLLIASGSGATIDRRTKITRLGAGVDKTGRLSPEALRRTLRVVEEYRAAMGAEGVDRALVIATSAVRDAENAADFLVPAAEILGSLPRVLPGTAEGRLSYRGAAAELGAAGGPYVVLDIGGGSTEMVTPAIEGAAERSVVSLDVGCVRITERFLDSDPPSAAELEEAASYTRRLVVEALEQGEGLRAGKRLVGLAGTVSALAVLGLGLPRYERNAVHHSVLTCDRVAELLDELAAMPLAVRRERPGLERARADVIVGGAIVLKVVLEVLGFSELLVSESDILDGIVAELLAPSGLLD